MRKGSLFEVRPSFAILFGEDPALREGSRMGKKDDKRPPIPR